MRRRKSRPRFLARLVLPGFVLLGLYGAYLIVGFFLVNPLAQRLLPEIGERELGGRLSVAEVRFNPFTLEATVHKLQLANPEGEVLAGFERLYLDLELAGLARRAWTVRQLELDQPYATFEIKPGGRLNWQPVIDTLARKPGSDSPVRILVGTIRVREGDVVYVDGNRVGELFRVAMKPLDLDLDGLSTLPEDRGEYLLAARLPEQGGTLKWKGELALNPFLSTGRIELERLDANRLLDALDRPRQFEVRSGTLGARLTYRAELVRETAGQGRLKLTVDQAEAQARDLVMVSTPGREPLLELRSLRTEGLAIDLDARTLTIDRLQLDGAAVAVTRMADGRVDWQALFAEPTPPVPSSPPRQGQAPWQIEVRAVEFVDGSVRFHDPTFESPLTLGIEAWSATFALSVLTGDSPTVRVTAPGAVFERIALSSGNRSLLNLARLDIGALAFESPERRLNVASVTLVGLTGAVELAHGRVRNWEAAFARSGARVTPPSPHTAASPGIALDLGSLRVMGVKLAVSEDSGVEPVRLDVDEGLFEAGRFVLNSPRAVPVRARFALRQGGRFRPRERWRLHVCRVSSMYRWRISRSSPLQAD